MYLGVFQPLNPRQRFRCRFVADRARPIPIDCDLESYGVSLEAVQTSLAEDQVWLEMDKLPELAGDEMLLLFCLLACLLAWLFVCLFVCLLACLLACLFVCFLLLGVR